MAENSIKVSVIIPFRNEEKFLRQCLLSVLNGNYPIENIELLLVDGGSTDNSFFVISDLASQNSNIKIFQNRDRIFPTAVNIGYKNSTGDYILILGAHAEYPEDYISKCISTAVLYNADNTGGILHTKGLNTSFIGNAISFCLSSTFGVGNSTFRTGSDEIKEVDTVFGGCYKREVFERIGLFNEKLVSSSDMDFNVRLKKNGGKIILDPSIHVAYYTRNSFKKFLRNNYRNGFWAIYPLKFVDYIPVKPRHFIPLLFVTGIITGVFVSFFSHFFLYIFASGIIMYFLLSIYFSFLFLRKGILYVLTLPLLFFLLHVTYGTGSLVALLRVVPSKIFRKNHK
jgi:glycosyltransferase involved in cell wall biosynthesis